MLLAIRICKFPFCQPSLRALHMYLHCFHCHFCSFLRYFAGSVHLLLLHCYRFLCLIICCKKRSTAITILVWLRLHCGQRLLWLCYRYLSSVSIGLTGARSGNYVMIWGHFSGRYWSLRRRRHSPSLLPMLIPPLCVPSAKKSLTRSSMWCWSLPVCVHVRILCACSLP